MIAPAVQTIWAIYRYKRGDDSSEKFWAELVIGWNEEDSAVILDGEGSGTAIQQCDDSPSFVCLVPDVCKNTASEDIRSAIDAAQGWPR